MNDLLGLVLVIFAAAAGCGLAVAAATLFRKTDNLDWMRGYDALAPVTQSQS